MEKDVSEMEVQPAKKVRLDLLKDSEKGPSA